MLDFLFEDCNDAICDNNSWRHFCSDLYVKDK